MVLLLRVSLRATFQFLSNICSSSTNTFIFFFRINSLAFQLQDSVCFSLWNRERLWRNFQGIKKLTLKTLFLILQKPNGSSPNRHRVTQLSYRFRMVSLPIWASKKKNHALKSKLSDQGWAKGINGHIFTVMDKN